MEKSAAIKNSLEIKLLKPWNEVSYEKALSVQAELNKKYLQLGKSGWLLFCCPPTITIGFNATKLDILLSQQEQVEYGVQVLHVNRGGQVTYHGPGQILFFPVGIHLIQHRGVRQFIAESLQWISRLVQPYLQEHVESIVGGPKSGLWVGNQKLLSLGLRFTREGCHHGFALNFFCLKREFSWIHPCGMRENSQSIPMSVFQTKWSEVERNKLKIFIYEIRASLVAQNGQLEEYWAGESLPDKHEAY